ncbi:MAG: glucose-6-phosphate isomerase [Erysipelothrix sp.]|nr:glucose-6-phosphate isomerase [Erysipelothrix sp.]
MYINFDEKKGYLSSKILEYQEVVDSAHEALHAKTGKGNDFLGWIDWPEKYDKEEFVEILKHAKKVKADADVLVVCGIGGSYLGARAAIEMINGLYPKGQVEIMYLGNTLSSTYIVQALDYLADKNFYVNVISKSGQTTETAMAFRLLKQLLKSKHQENYKDYIIATTDPKNGTLRAEVNDVGYKSFSIPADIGGRFSVTTAVGLFPLAVAGISIEEVMRGALTAYKELDNPDLNVNPAYQYAVARRIMEKQGKSVEMLVSYEFQMTMFAEWWKQLFGESEGKEGRGILPTSVNFSTDLHSMGQFIQEGSKNLFETLIAVEEPMEDMIFPIDEEDKDNMNYLSGKSLDYVNTQARLGTLAAHYDEGSVPNLIITIPDTSAYTFGYLTYFFFKSIAMSAYLINVNPFNQPGVEVYKRNMFKLLGKI